MNTTIQKGRFDKWKSNLQPDGDLPVFTTDALINLDELDQFVSEMKGKQAKSNRINHVLFDWKDNDPQQIKEKDENHPRGCKSNVVKDNTTQVGIVINGAGKIKTNPDYTIEADDIFEANGDIRLLIPGEEKEGPSGHNPPAPKIGTGS